MGREANLKHIWPPSKLGDWVLGCIMPARLGSARLRLARLGLARLGSVRFSSARLGSAHKSQIPDPRPQIPNPRSQMPDSTCQIFFNSDLPIILHFGDIDVSKCTTVANFIWDWQLKATARNPPFLYILCQFLFFFSRRNWI